LLPWSNAMSDQRIDDAIDRAVREIMHAEPDADFRRRVLLRIEQPARTAWVWGPGFAAAALAILIVVTFFVARRSPTPVPVEETVSNRPAVSVPSAPPKAIQQPAPPRAAPPREMVARTRTIRARTRSIQELQAFESGVEIDPITVDLIEANPVQRPAVDVTPLAALTPIEVAPLPPPSGRN
jgi:hypothetical protein